MDESKKPQIRPFLQGALDKDPLDRTFLEKLAVGIYGPDRDWETHQCSLRHYISD